MLAAVLLMTACSSGGDAGLTAVPTTSASSAIAFAVTGATVESVALPPPPFPDDVKASVLATLDRYLQDAVLGPLRSGGRAGDLEPVFTGRARARVDGPDRAALVDEGVAPAAGDSVRSEAATLGLAALAGADNAVTVVTATVDLRLRTGGDDEVAISRSGQLVLVPDGGSWKIDGYDIRTRRDGGASATATTARG